MSPVRLLILFAVIAGVAIEAPAYLERATVSAPDGVTSGQPAEEDAARPSGPAATTIKADAAGHFTSRFRLNGKAIVSLIDTGATLIAINESTARSIGIGGDRLRFDARVETANGRAEAARVVIGSVEIGSIRVRNVEAMVLRDEALDSVLIGMSFMNKLSSWKVEAGQMQLVN